MFKTIYWNAVFVGNRNIGALGKPQFVNCFDVLKRLLKETTDHYIFIVLPEQYPQWQAWVERENLQEHIVWDMGKFIKNINYPNYEPRLRVMVMKGIVK